MGRLVLVAGLLASMTACDADPRPLSWSVELDPALEAGTRVVRASVRRGGCLAASEIYAADVPRRAAGSMPPPVLGPGTYGLAALAIDETCDVVGEGCTDVTLPTDERGVVVVVLPRAPSAACPPGAICRAGLCGQPDAGPPDGGPADTGPPDTGSRDAGGVLDAGPGDAGGRDAGRADTGSPVPTCPLDPSLVLCLGFEGTVTDGSSFGQRVAASGVTFVDGVHGSAGRLDATSVIDVADADSLSPPERTIEAWVRPEALSDAEIMEKDREYGVTLLADGRPMCWIRATDLMTVVGTARLVVDAWSHVACTYDGADLTAWVDGVAVGSGMVTPADVGDAILGIGRDPEGIQQLSGALDDVRIYSRALTGEEVALEARP